MVQAFAQGALVTSTNSGVWYSHNRRDGTLVENIDRDGLDISEGTAVFDSAGNLYCAVERTTAPFLAVVRYLQNGTDAGIWFSVPATDPLDGKFPTAIVDMIYQPSDNSIYLLLLTQDGVELNDHLRLWRIDATGTHTTSWVLSKSPEPVSANGHWWQGSLGADRRIVFYGHVNGTFSVRRFDVTTGTQLADLFVLDPLSQFIGAPCALADGGVLVRHFDVVGGFLVNQGQARYNTSGVRTHKFIAPTGGRHQFGWRMTIALELEYTWGVDISDQADYRLERLNVNTGVIDASISLDEAHPVDGTQAYTHVTTWAFLNQQVRRAGRTSTVVGAT